VGQENLLSKKREDYRATWFLPGVFEDRKILYANGEAYNRNDEIHSG